MSYFVSESVSLSPKQLQCVGLLASGMSQKDVAESLGVSTKSIQRWQKLPEFLQTLESAQVRQATPQQAAKVASEVVKDALSQRDYLRSREVALLDKLEEKLLAYIESDGLGYRVAGLVQSIVRISERRSKLLGLDIRTLGVLDAVELLLHEEILSAAHAGIVFEGVKNIEQNLRIIEVQKESPNEIKAIKNLTPEQLAQEYRNLIDESC